MKKKSELIEKIRKKFHREYLLIAVDKVDEKTTTPLTGRLIFHSPHRDEVYKKMMKHRGLDFFVYSEDSFPKGMAAAFYEQ